MKRTARATLLLALLLTTSTLACQQSSGSTHNGQPIVNQGSIADIACGPCAMFNWMSQGGEQLNGVLTTFAEEKTPEQTVRQIIDTYGTRTSVTNPSVARYGPHNGGVGSVNLMVMARELLGDHLESPPTLRGEYLQQRDGESNREHLERIVGWFSESIDSGIPVLFYLRGYKRTSGHSRQPPMTFGHHVVILSLDGALEDVEGKASRIGFTFADSSSGRVDQGVLQVADQVFTAPTFTYRFEGERALTTERIRSGRPLLEVRIPSYESAYPPGTDIITAHFATFADRD